jgi:hypothetical protein
VIAKWDYDFFITVQVGAAACAHKRKQELAIAGIAASASKH